MNQKGVTLLELLVVVVVLGIVFAIGAITFTSVINNTEEKMVENEAVIIKNAVDVHCMQHDCPISENDNGWVDVNDNDNTDLPTYNGQASNIAYRINADGSIDVKFELHGYQYDKGTIS